MKLQYAVTLIREFSDECEEAAEVKHCTQMHVVVIQL